MFGLVTIVGIVIANDAVSVWGRRAVTVALSLVLVTLVVRVVRLVGTKPRIKRVHTDVGEDAGRLVVVEPTATAESDGQWWEEVRAQRWWGAITLLAGSLAGCVATLFINPRPEALVAGFVVGAMFARGLLMGFWPSVNDVLEQTRSEPAWLWAGVQRIVNRVTSYSFYIHHYRAAAAIGVIGVSLILGGHDGVVATTVVNATEFLSSIVAQDDGDSSPAEGESSTTTTTSVPSTPDTDDESPSPDPHRPAAPSLRPCRESLRDVVSEAAGPRFAEAFDAAAGEQAYWANQCWDDGVDFELHGPHTWVLLPHGGQLATAIVFSGQPLEALPLFADHHKALEHFRTGRSLQRVFPRYPTGSGTWTLFAATTGECLMTIAAPSGSTLRIVDPPIARALLTYAVDRERYVASYSVIEGERRYARFAVTLETVAEGIDEEHVIVWQDRETRDAAITDGRPPTASTFTGTENPRSCAELVEAYGPLSLEACHNNPTASDHDCRVYGPYEQPPP